MRRRGSEAGLDLRARALASMFTTTGLRRSAISAKFTEPAGPMGA
jgi:hypothetical protein